MKLPLTLLPLVVVGCDSASGYFPLEVNQSATYRVRGFEKATTVITVKRVVSVAGGRGFELQGPSGVDRIGWSNGTLYADQLANSRFTPPIPLLRPGNVGDPIEWKGNVFFLETQEKGSATLVQAKKKDTFNGRPVTTIEATVSLSTPNRKVELVCTYAAGVGLIRQQQRTNDQFDLELTRL